MDPRHLASFFEKYKKLPTPRRYFISALNEFLGIEKGVTDVSIQNGVLYVKAPGAIKQEIFLKKQKILNFLKEKDLDLIITDIR